MLSTVLSLSESLHIPEYSGSSSGIAGRGLLRKSSERVGVNGVLSNVGGITLSNPSRDRDGRTGGGMREA